MFWTDHNLRTTRPIARKLSEIVALILEEVFIFEPRSLAPLGEKLGFFHFLLPD